MSTQTQKRRKSEILGAVKAEAIKLASRSRAWSQGSDGKVMQAGRGRHGPRPSNLGWELVLKLLVLSARCLTLGTRTPTDNGAHSELAVASSSHAHLKKLTQVGLQALKES